MNSPVNNSDAERVRTFWTARRDVVETFMRERLPSSNGPAHRLTEAMRYSLEAGGKRLRPILVTAAADFVAARPAWDASSHDWWLGESPDREAILLYATAMEFIHTYSLIHDDLPCMDDDELRRGKPTCHVAFDEATAVLAGDALNTDAFVLIAQVAPEYRERGLLAAGELARAAGSGGMVAGQMADLEATGERDSQDKPDIPPEKRLVYIHRHKTAALFRAALVGGGIMAGADKRDLGILSIVGEKVGLLFQVIDDILDVTSDTATLGKTAGRDEDLDKLTYPALFGLEVAREQAQLLLREALDSLAPTGDRGIFLRAIAEFIVSRSS